MDWGQGYIFNIHTNSQNLVRGKKNQPLKKEGKKISQGNDDKKGINRKRGEKTGKRGKQWEKEGSSWKKRKAKGKR